MKIRIWLFFLCLTVFLNQPSHADSRTDFNEMLILIGYADENQPIESFRFYHNFYFQLGLYTSERILEKLFLLGYTQDKENPSRYNNRKLKR